MTLGIREAALEYSARAGQPRRLPQLDLIRLLAVSAVIVMLHSQAYVAGVSQRSLLPDAGWPELITILCNGLVSAVAGHSLALSWRSRPTRPVIPYLAKRVIRLWPLYVAALLIFLRLWFRDESVLWYLAQFFSVGILFTGVLPPVVATLWYVQVSMVYTVLGVLILARRSLVSRVIAALAVVTVVYVWCEAMGIGDRRLLLYVTPFLVGVFTPHIRLAPGVRYLLFAVGISLAYLTADQPAYGAGQFVLIARCLFPALLYPLLLAVGGSLIRSGHPIAWLKRAAYATYCAYLFHRPVMSVLRRVSPKVQGFVPALLTYSVLGFVLSLVVGWCIQYLYDLVVRRVSAAMS